MRTSTGFNATVVAAPGTSTEAVARGGGSTHSAWSSPVPYLFGGLAAMLGLIAFALLILACSYWKLSGFLENGGDSTEDSSSKQESEEKPAPSWYEERIVVIMAGEEKPRYLATPICSRASSFGDNSSSSSSSSTTSSSRDDGEVDGKKVDDVVIEAEALKSNLDDARPEQEQQQPAESS